MKKPSLFSAAFATGALAVLWVAAGFLGTHLLALVMTLVIGAVFAFGAYELRQFRRATASLDAALVDLAAQPAQVEDLQPWLERIHPALRNAVRLRIEGERVGLPGPALTPYLAGLLVMLGMLGTFVGMVATFNGAVLALDGSTDLAAIRAAIAAPIKGLGLAFGTSVAGVAASAMLGLMASLARRERLHAGQRLDGIIAGELRGHSLTHQRQETYRALQDQAQALPRVADQMQALMTQLEQMNRQLGEQLSQRLLANQEEFHTGMREVYGELARSVGQSLQDSLRQGAAAAGASLTPVVEAALAGIAEDARAMHARIADTAQDLATRFEANTNTLAEHWEEVLARHEQSHTALLEERGHLLDRLNGLFDASEQAANAQRASIDTLVAAAAGTLDQAGDRFAARMDAAGMKLDDAAAQVAAGAIDVASLGDAFGAAVQAFSLSNTQLVDSLRRIEAALDKSLLRSDEQLAYYVAQAREVIDLSLSSQKEIFDELRQLPARAPAGVN